MIAVTTFLLRFRRFRRSPAHWISAGAVLAVFALFVAPLRTNNPCDYYRFWAVVRFMPVTPVTNIYSPRDSAIICDAAMSGADESSSELERRFRKGYRALNSTATPLHYAVFALAARGDFRIDYDRFRRASAVLYAVGLLAMAAYLGFPLWSMPLLLLYFTVFFWPYRRDIIDANASAALAGAVMMALAGLGSPRGGARFLVGLALGVLALFKPTVAYVPVFIALAFLLTERSALTPFLWGLATAAVAGYWLPAVVLGEPCTWWNWHGAAFGRAMEIRQFSGGVPGRVLGMKSLGPFQAFSILTLVAAAAGIAVVLRRPQGRFFDGAVRHHAPHGFIAVGAGAIGLCCYLLSGPLVWGHYFTLAVPAALIALRPRSYRPDPRWILRGTALAACALLGLHNYFRAWGLTAWGNYSPFTILGAVLVTGIVFWDLRDHRVWRLGAGKTESASG